MANDGTAKGRVQAELEDLRMKNQKLGCLLGKIKSENDYIRIHEKKLKIWVEE